MKLPKSRLDEMQEAKNRKIGTIGLRLAVTTLTIASITEILLYPDEQLYWAEYCIMIGLCIYAIISNLIIGVWDKYFKPGIKTYLIMSCLSGSLTGVLVYITSTLYGAVYSSILDSLLFAGIASCTSFLLYCFLGKLYRGRRKKLDRGEEYRELAEKVGVTVHTLKSIENGSYNPSIKLCRKICQATGKTLDELFGDEQSFQILKQRNSL